MQQALVVTSGWAAEKDPPGDIPDDQVFIPYRSEGPLFTALQLWRCVGAVLQFRSEVLAILTETVMIPDAPELAGKRRGRFRLELQKNKI
jgi:hypothetical protein